MRPPDHADVRTWTDTWRTRVRVLSFGVNGGREAARVSSMRSGFSRGSSTSGCEVARLPSGDDDAPSARRRRKAKAGVSEDMVRLSVCIEHIDD